MHAMPPAPPSSSSTRRSLLALLSVCTLLPACGGYDSFAGSYGGPGGGATPGGAQDVGYARTLIRSGQVPEASAYAVEGLYSEHDLPLPGDGVCEKVLCVGGAGAAVEFVDDGKSDALVQVGFRSGIDVANFKRAPLNLALVVDISGSMAEALPGGPLGEGKIDVVRAALQRIVARLDARDRLAIVLFDTRADVIRASAPVSDVAAIARLIAERVQTAGGTNIEAGLGAGFAEVGRSAGQVGVQDRVMLFTDARPNVGATDAASFRGMVAAGAKQGIGLSAFGVGLDFGVELAYAISHERGGNYFFLEDAARLRQVLDEEFDFVVTPLAYELTLRVNPADGLKIASVYGLPEDTILGGGLNLAVPTIFLSKRKGAIALRVAAATPLTGPVDFAKATLHYTTAGGTPVDETLALSGPGDGVGAKAEADPAGLERIAALTNMYLAMRAASARAKQAGGSKEAAIAALDLAIAQLRRVASAQKDASFDKEADLLLALEQNVMRLP